MGKKVDLNKKHSTPIFNRNHKNNYSMHAPKSNMENSQNGEDSSLQSPENIENRTSDIESGLSLRNRFSSSNNRKKSKNNKELMILMKKAATKKIIIISGIFFIGLLFLLLIIFMISSITQFQAKKNIAMGGYYSMKCSEVTVIFTDKSNGYQVTGSNTYPLEEYVAGVVAGEVGYFGDLEVDKAFAVAARSYFLAHEENCTIESSDRKQVFRDLTGTHNDKLALQAAEETKGKVLLSNNELFSSQYDAFACIAKDSSYYTVSQANQKIPISWVEDKLTPSKNPSWFICNGKENLRNHHGNGMSQYGAWYLSEQLKYTYDEIINFYLGDDVVISSDALLSIAGLDVKNTTNSEILTIRLDEFLKQRGSSLEQLNRFIHGSVVENGAGTREGVVTAAVSLVNFLYDNYRFRLPYYWGGEYQNYGVSGGFGGRTTPRTSTYGTTYNYAGFDCSGFVSWAIKNGGYNIGRNTTMGFHDKFSSNSCNITSYDCIGKPGDLINSRNSHVQMIVAVDQNAGKYMVVEATGSQGLIMREWDMHIGNTSGEQTLILNMDSFYNNPNNVDPNY